MKKTKPRLPYPRLHLHLRAVQVSAFIRVLFPSLIALLVLAACTSTNQLGSRRPAPDTVGSVEAYLARYQPGPTPRLFQTTRLYDRNGATIAELWNEGRRTWVGLDRISKHLIDATIATEDATFYQNTGVDPARIAAAALRNTQEGEVTSGASTITMQLARNLFMGPDQRYDQTMDRKVLEAGLAQELTNLFSKDELLEMYLNLLNYGHWTYGPEAASQVYFGKHAADLTQAEATLLAGIPQRPADFDLFTDFAAAKARQRVVLDMLVRHEYLTDAQADTIFAQLIKLNPKPDQAVNLAPHFVQYVQETLDAAPGRRRRGEAQRLADHHHTRSEGANGRPGPHQEESRRAQTRARSEQRRAGSPSARHRTGSWPWSAARTSTTRPSPDRST